MVPIKLLSLGLVGRNLRSIRDPLPILPAELSFLFDLKTPDVVSFDAPLDPDRAVRLKL